MSNNSKFNIFVLGKKWINVNEVKISKSVEDMNTEISCFIRTHFKEFTFEPVVFKTGEREEDILVSVLFNVEAYRNGKTFNFLQYSENTQQFRIIPYGINFKFHTNEGTNPLELEHKEIKKYTIENFEKFKNKIENDLNENKDFGSDLTHYLNEVTKPHFKKAIKNNSYIFGV